MRLLVLVTFGICILFLNLSNNCQGFPFSFPFLPPDGPPIEINLHSSLNFSDPQFTLFDYEDIDDGIEGQLVIADPFNACSPIQLAPGAGAADHFDYYDEDGELQYPKSDQQIKSKFWILLTNNLNCDLPTKLFHASAAKYSAVLVGNMEPDNEIDRDFFFGDEGIVHVRTAPPAENRRNNLRDQIGYQDSFEYLGKIRFSEFVLPDLISYALVTFIGVATGLVALIVLIWLFQLIGGERLVNYCESQRKSGIVAVALKDTIVQRWTSDAPFLNNESCTICLDDFAPEDHIRILNCLHGFHTSCIDPWLLKVNPTCPICKQELTTDRQSYHLDAESDGDDITPLLSVPVPIQILDLQSDSEDDRSDLRAVI